MINAKPIKKPESIVKTMLIEDRFDAITYIKDKLTINGLRSATQNLQAVCNIVHQILVSPMSNIVDAYKIANIVATGYHEDIDIFQEIERKAIEAHMGHIHVPYYVNLDEAYCSPKLTTVKSDYLAEGVANMLDILNLTAHVLSRELITKKSILIANELVLQARYEFGKDIVAATDMSRIWKTIVTNAPETVIGPSNKFITIGTTYYFNGHHIHFTPCGIYVDNEDPDKKQKVYLNSVNRTYCALRFNGINSWLYFHHSGDFGLQWTNGGPCYKIANIQAPKSLSESIYRELIA
jgi:hypothetical protein